MSGPGYVTVVVPDVPARGLLDLDDHISELVREVRLVAIGHYTGMAAGPPRLVELVEELSEQYRSIREDTRRQAELAAAAGADKVTVRLWLPPAAADAAIRFVELLDELEDYCRSEQLLTLSARADLVEFRNWYVNQVVRQLLVA